MQSDLRTSTLRDTRDEVSCLSQYISSGATYIVGLSFLYPALLLERPGMKLWSDLHASFGSVWGWRAFLCSWLRECLCLVLSIPVVLNKQVS